MSRAKRKVLSKIRSIVSDFVLIKHIAIFIIAAIPFISSFFPKINKFFVTYLFAGGGQLRTSRVIHLFFGIFLLEFIVIYFFKIRKIRRRKLLNPGIKYLYTIVSFEQNIEEGKSHLYQYVQELDFKTTLEGVNSYRLIFSWEGSEPDFTYRAFEINDSNERIEIGITRIYPRTQQQSRYRYSVVLSNNMRKGERKKLIIEFSNLSDRKNRQPRRLTFSTDSPVRCMTLKLSFKEQKSFQRSISTRGDRPDNLPGYPQNYGVRREISWDVHKDVKRISRNHMYSLLWEND